jgi:small neutral amino acid transporter SnatA (MarC family)
MTSGSGPRPARRVWMAGLTVAVLLAASFFVVAPPERCPTVTERALRSSAQASVDWFARNQNADGTWLYLYKRGDDSVPPEYNVVRHTGAVMGLYRAAADGLPRALGPADRGTDWALGHLLERDGWSAVELDGEVATGATALFAAGLTLRRQATGDTRYDDLLRRFGRFLVAQTERSGAVLASYDPVRGSPVAGEYSKYYTGEAYWGLTRLQRVFPGEGWGRAASRVGAYLATSRDEVEDHWPPVQDHWAAYGLSETVEFADRGRPPLTAAEVRYARRQAELFGATVRWIAARFGPWGGLVRGSDVPRGGGYGVISEALTGLWLTARADPRLAELQGPIAERAACIAGLAVRAQSDRADAARFARPDRVEGAWFRDGETRMDDQQHALAGLLRTIPIVRAHERAGSSDDPPSGWLWFVALLAALNPARAAFAVPRAGRSRREVVGLVAAGGAIGGLAVCAVAALGGPLLDALDVSDPAFRLAAGIVAVLAGAADFFRRPPAPEPALAGWRAAIVPVAVPAIARPALLVMALGAGADRGVPVTAAAMAAAVVSTVFTVRWAAERPGGRVVRWVGALLAASLVACGALLGVDGVLDV